MLNQFRNAFRGVFKWIFGALIIVAFGFAGVSGLDNFGNTAAITVGDKKISARDLELELRTQLQLVQAENPGLTRDEALQAGLGNQAIETMILRTLLELEGERLGLAAPNDVVRAYLEEIPAFQDPDSGNFDSQRVGLFLQQRGLSTESFRELIGNELVRTQLVEAIQAGQSAPSDLARFLLVRQSEEREVSHARVAIDALAAEPSDEEIEAAYTENLDRYQSPEYRVFTVVTIGRDDVADQIDVTEDEVRQLYDARVGAAAARERRSLRQVTLRGEAAEAFQTALGEGASFEEAAASVSGNVSTLTDQLRSDFINSDVAEAVFAAEPGTVAGPVETAFGQVFAEVTSVSGDQEGSFDEQRAALEEELRAEVAVDRLLELVEQFEVARDEGASISEAAEQVSLSARTTQPADRELFTPAGSIANIPRSLAREGFLLLEGEESQALDLGDGYGFVGVEEIRAPQPLPLDEVRDRVVARIKAERSGDQAAAIKARFEALLAEGKSFSEAAAELGGEAQTVTFSNRNPEAGIPAAAVQAATNLQVGATEVVPAGDAPAVDIVMLNDVRYSGTENLDQLIPLVSGQFGSQLSNELNEAYLDALRATTEVSQNPSQVARALGQEPS